MVKALLWKEWREQRVIAAAGLAMGLLLPMIIFAVAVSASSAMHLSDVSDLIPFLLATLVWPLFAAFAGASANAQEASGGTLRFLLSRPVGRSRVWLVKAVSALTSLGVIVAGSFANAWFLDWSVGGHGFQFPFSSDPIETDVLPSAAVQVTALMLPLLALACGLLFSTFLKRQLVAALAGSGTAILVVGAGIGWMRLITADPRLSYGGDSFLLGYFVVAAGAVLAGAFLAFSWGVMLPGAERKKIIATALVGIVAVVLGGTQAIVAVTTRPDPSTGWLRLAAVDKSGNGIVVSAQRTRFAGDSLWWATPGRPLQRLTDRLAEAPVVSPDGEWVVYASRLGPFGMRRDDCDLRAVHPNGADDHVVATSVPCASAPVFSHDGRRLAVANMPGPTVLIGRFGRPTRALSVLADAERFAAPAEFRLLVVPIAPAGGEENPKALEPPRGNGYAVAWTADDRELLWISGGREAALSLVDVETGAATELLAYPDDGPRAASAVPQRTDLAVPLVSETHVLVEARHHERRNSRDLYTVEIEYALIEPASGALIALPEFCPQWADALAFAGDGSMLVYGACTDPSAGSSLLLRDLDSGAETSLAAFDGRVYALRSSPAASAFWVRVRDRGDTSGRSSHREFVLDLDGNVQRVEAPEIPGAAFQWGIERWLDDTHLLLGRYVGGSHNEYARLDVWTGELEMLVGGRR